MDAGATTNTPATNTGATTNTPATTNAPATTNTPATRNTGGTTGPKPGRRVNQRLKRWPGWVMLALAVVGLLAFGATRDTGPRTPDERIESISKRLACPVCQGESVYESRNPASTQIREAIRRGVADGDQTDEEIIQQIVVAYEGEELLVPTASGVEALAWALPAAAFVIGLIGLAIAFRRWRANTAALGDATDDDYELVAKAMADFDDQRPHDRGT